MTFLQTPRLEIRPLTPGDLPTVLAYRNDPEVARYQGWDVPATPAQVASLIGNPDLGTPGWSQHGIYTTDGLLLGDVAVHGEDEQAEVGITLSRDGQGRGYATEALRAVVDHLFVARGLHRVHAGIDPRNRAVARLLIRCGFRHEGTELRSYLHRGEWTDNALYAVLRSEWTRPAKPRDRG